MNPGVFQDNFGGDIKFQLGMDQIEKYLLQKIKKKQNSRQKNFIKKKLVCTNPDLTVHRGGVEEYCAGKIAEIDAPTSRMKGTNIDVTGKNSVNMIGNYVESAAGVQQSSSSLVDIFQGSFIGQLLNSLGNLKKFLKIVT